MIDTISKIEIVADTYNIPVEIYPIGDYKDVCVLTAKESSFTIEFHHTSNEFFICKIIEKSIVKKLILQDIHQLFKYIDMFCKKNSEII